MGWHVEKPCYRHMTMDKANEMRREYYQSRISDAAKRVTQQDLAEKFRLKQATVSRILNYDSWSGPSAWFPEENIQMRRR